MNAFAVAAADYAAAVVSIAARAGFAITADQVQAAQLASVPSEISEDDLSGVTGGKGWPSVIWPIT
jgi:hypothetical protein